MKHKIHKNNIKVKVILLFSLLLVIGLVVGFVYGKQKNNATIQQAYSEQDLASSINTEGLEDEFEDAFRGKDEAEIVVLEDAEQEEQVEQKEQEEQKNEKTTKKTENTSNTKNTGNTTYYIKVNKLANVVTIYKKDENDDYTVPVKAMNCSTGTYTPAVSKYPKTQYKITGYKTRWSRLQGDVYGQYITQIVGNILFHSVPYTEKNNSSLEYWEYDKLGTTASAGCIRLTVADAKWIYNNISKGTVVEFYSDSNPGPLGRPSTQKISSNVACRGWDPTDTSDGNPWRNVKNEEKSEAEKPENTIENTTKTTSENTLVNTVVEQAIKSDTTQNTVKENQKINEVVNVVTGNTENIGMDKSNAENTNTEATNAKNENNENANTESANADETNSEKSNTEKTNTEKANSENTNTEKTNTEKLNTGKTNTDNTNTEKANTDNTNTEKTNTEKTNTDNTNAELN